VVLAAAQMAELATLLEALLREIAAALATGGSSAMTKIRSEHLARSAYVYIRQSTPISSRTTTKAGEGNTGSPTAPGNSVGRRSR
jgi:hypothetical protein